MILPCGCSATHESKTHVRIVVAEKTCNAKHKYLEVLSLFGAIAMTGVKHDAQKPRFSLVPDSALDEVIDVLEFGAQKYAPDNWKKVPDLRTRYFNASIRHIRAWHAGEKLDPESGKHHLAHAVCCLLFLLWSDKNSETS